MGFKNLIKTNNLPMTYRRWNIVILIELDNYQFNKYVSY